MLDFETWKLNHLHDRVAAVAPITGVSTSERDSIDTRRVDFLPEATQVQRDQAHAIADGHDTLAIGASKTIIATDGVDEAGITSAPLTTFEYTIWRDGLLDSSGTVNDGVLELSAVEVGNYQIEIRSGSNTGYVEVTAQ